MKPTIYFDMDGTIADLYSVNNWLERLRASDPKPYSEAKPLINLRQLVILLDKLQRKGYKIGIITWLAKDAEKNYCESVRKRKKAWLNKHLNSIFFDEVHMVKYGTPKHRVAKDKNGILFDDNDRIRKEWGKKAFSEKEIFEKLKELLK